MAAGVPSVATTVGGVPEIARDRETALLVGAADPEALARALHLLLTSPREARMLADRAARHVLENFSPEAQTRALREVYASVFEFSHVSSRTAPATGGAPSSVASQQ
jgi:glycosyltransferase involved in cell wall biosynthesis